MAQFEVFKNPRGGDYPLLLDCQADLLSRLPTRVVAPLSTLKRFGATPISRLNPIVKIGRQRYVVVLQELAAVSIDALGPIVGSLRAERGAIVAALDLLFTGF